MREIPFNKIGPYESFDPESAREAVIGALYSGQYLFGEQTKRFEQELSELAKNGFSLENMLSDYKVGDFTSVAVNSGTDALTIMLRASMPEGSYIATTPIAPPAVLTAILRAGMVPIFCDVEKSGLISIESLGDLYDDFEIDAVLAIHMYGQLCDMKELDAFVKTNGIRVFEDAAQAMWSIRDGYSVGRYSEAAAFSFYPTKNLGAVGDAGAIIFKDPVADGRARALRFYNVLAGNEKLMQGQSSCGFNSRMDEIQAAFLRSQLQYSCNHITSIRRSIAARYFSRLKPELLHREIGNGHLYTIITDDRDAVQKELLSHGITTKVHYPTPLHRQLPFSDITEFQMECPVADWLSTKVLSLPIYPSMTIDDMDYVIKLVNEIAHYAA